MMKTMDEKSISDIKLNAVQAGELLEVSPQTVTNWIKRGRLEAEKVGSGRTEEWQIPLLEIAREAEEDTIRARVLKEKVDEGLTRYYQQLNAVIEAAEHLKSLRNEHLDWGDEDHDPGDAIKAFKKLDYAFVDLLQKVLTAQSERSVNLLIEDYIKAIEKD